MKTGKEIIYEYCKEISKLDTEHIDNCKYNIRRFEKDEINYLVGCPSSYGIKDFTGDCEIKPLVDNNPIKQDEQCNKCWDRAFSLTY